MPNYSEGKIYKVVNSINSLIYIGSTCQRLCIRMADHRRKAKDVRNTQNLFVAMRS